MAFAISRSELDPFSLKIAALGRLLSLRGVCDVAICLLVTDCFIVFAITFSIFPVKCLGNVYCNG